MMTKEIVLFEKDLLQVIAAVRFKIDHHSDLFWFLGFRDADNLDEFPVCFDQVFGRVDQLGVVEIANNPRDTFLNAMHGGRMKTVEFEHDHLALG